MLRAVGIDFRSIAVPLDAVPLRQLRGDPDLWAVAADHPPFGRAWGDETLPEISRAVLAATPPGTGWVGHFGDRSFVQAEYLLDPAAWRAGSGTWDERRRSWAYRAVNGAEPFTDHTTGGPDFPWRCSTGAFLAAAAERIERLDVAAVRAQFSVAEMDALGLYKVNAEEGDEGAFARVLGQVRAFAEHCRTVAARGLDLIITRY